MVTGVNNKAIRGGNVIHNDNEHEFTSEKAEFPSCGVTLRGNFLKPKNVQGKLPCIVMSPGMSGVKEGSIFRYAEYFAKGGFTVLAYDNINFGESDKPVPQEADPMLQRRGYRDAISYVRLRPEVDRERIGIWGTSYSGGHVMEVGAHDRRVKCVVSQIGPVSGYQGYLRRVRPDQREQFLKRQDEDREARFLGKPPKTIKAVSNDPNEPCVMPGIAAYDYFMEQARHAPNWKNELTLRSTDLSRGLENSAFLPYAFPTPLMMIVALQDELAPADLSIAAFNKLNDPKKLVLIPGGHFTPYVEEFAVTGNEARDWFTRHLVYGGSLALNQ